jgi:hypothetical protein
VLVCSCIGKAQKKNFQAQGSTSRLAPAHAQLTNWWRPSRRFLKPRAPNGQKCLFAAGSGVYWSSVCEHFTWRRLALRNDDTQLLSRVNSAESLRGYAKCTVELARQILKCDEARGFNDGVVIEVAS